MRPIGFRFLRIPSSRRLFAPLKRTPRACLVVNREVLNSLAELGVKPAGPLNDYLAENFSPAFTLDGFEFCVRRGRRIVPLMLANTHVPPPSYKENTALQLTLLLPEDRAVASVEIAASPDAAGR